MTKMQLPAGAKRASPAPALVFLCLVIPIFLVFWLAIPLRFRTNDDTAMMMLASGAYSGTPSDNLVFIGAYLASLMRSLYTLMPGFDWYPGLQLLAMSACAALVGVAGFHNWQGKHPFFLFAWTALGALVLSCIVELQFTTTAALAVTLGSWSLLALPGRLLPAVGAALLLYGLQLRFEAGALAILVGAPFILLGLWRRVALRWRGFLLCALIGLGLHLAAEQSSRAQNPDYVTYNELRGKVNDNPIAAALPNQALPKGISPNDYALFSAFFADPSEIDLDTLKKIHAAVIARERALSLGDFATAIAAVFKRQEVLLILAGLILAGAALPGRSQKLLLCAGILAFLLPLFYVSTFALLKNRVLISACAAVLGGLLFLNLRASPLWRNLLLQLPLIALSGLFVIQAKDRLGYTLYLKPLVRTQSAMITAWDGRVYVFRNHYNPERARLFSDDVPVEPGKIVFVGWMVGHPDNRLYQSHKDLLRADAALFMAPGPDAQTYIDQILTALQENHGITAMAQVHEETRYGMLVVFDAASG